MHDTRGSSPHTLDASSDQIEIRPRHLSFQSDAHGSSTGFSMHERTAIGIDDVRVDPLDVNSRRTRYKKPACFGEAIDEFTEKQKADQENPTTTLL